MLALIVLCTLLVSIVSLIGILLFLLREELMRRAVNYLVAFAAGSLMGVALLHILPEVSEELEVKLVASLIVVGFVAFFLLEHVLRWRHCHSFFGCEAHPFTLMSIIGDGVHNFVDGLVIASSFLLDPALGFLTTFGIVAHEVPQELGDFGILVYGGFPKHKALYLNLFSALTAVAGGIVGFYLPLLVEESKLMLLPLAAGGFIYIAASDLLPELRHTTPQRSLVAVLPFLAGIGVMLLMLGFE